MCPFDKNIKEEIGRRSDVTLRRKVYQEHDRITFYHMIISTEKQRRTMISCFYYTSRRRWADFYTIAHYLLPFVYS